MTKEEILAKVQATIAGQGNEVDLGGALPAILNAIVELIPGSGVKVYDALDEAGVAEVSRDVIESIAQDFQKGNCIILTNDQGIVTSMVQSVVVDSEAGTIEISYMIGGETKKIEEV